MSNYNIYSLLKLGQEEHINDLYHNGTVYMNSIQYFRKIEDCELRGDKFEGLSSIKNYPPGQFEIPSINFKGNYISMQLRASYPIVLGNIFSLYCVSSNGWKRPQDFKIDEKNKRFGSSCLFIKDAGQFISLIEKELKRLELKYYHGFVEYYDKNLINGNLTVFDKPLEFEYQKEFRFYIRRNSDKPLKLSIGSLYDIAEILPAEQVIDTMQLKSNR